MKEALREPLEVRVASASGEKDGRVAQLVPLLKLRHLGDRSFDYLVPPDLVEHVGAGSVVTAPFGRRTARAVVVGMGSSVNKEIGDLRLIEAAETDMIPAELLDLARAVSRRYLSSYEACLRLVVPPRAPRGAGRDLSPRNTWVTPAVGATEQTLRLTQKQQALLEAIPGEGASAVALCREAGVSRAVLEALVAKGLAHLGPAPEVPSEGIGYVAGAAWSSAGGEDDAAVPQLWPDQEQAVAELVAAYDGPGLAERLLWGVTGSGKTEVYLRLIAYALERGAGAILLVPEIALTPQMIARVRARFGDQVGVFHSGLAAGVRLREYRRIAAGRARVVVGARSAVFAPVSNLRLVIIDESHDASYKQEEEPRYHARVVAAMRLQSSRRGLLLEGSATPAVESMARPEQRFRLARRATGRVPSCQAVDMRRQGGGELLAPVSREALADTLRRGEQAIVLLNRRGYAGYVYCELCGHVMMCDSCDLSLTYHSRVRRLVCHHCGRVYAQPPLCPSCGEAPLVRAAPGTERLDRELRTLVPRDKVFRMDSDVLTSGTRVCSVLAAFANARPAVLVGTQMVAKGHDFPDVTLVIVADADTGLYIPDFRAAERTFQLLTQVAGRAGRADKRGRVLVQTWNPDVPCIRMALEQDEAGFYEQEIELRRRLGYPPFADIIRVMTLSGQGERAQAGAQYLTEQLRPHFAAEEVRGPVRLPVLRGRDRWHLLIATPEGERARAVVRQAMTQLEEPYRRRGVVLLADVDPQSFG